MPRLDSPLQLLPEFKPKIWGRRDLTPIFRPDRNPSLRSVTPAPGESSLIGEAWLTGDGARFLSGSIAGLTLARAVRECGAELVGRNCAAGRFPVLAKYLYTSDWLSVQVHPNDDYARSHDPGSLGKREMWYIVQAGRGAQILLGVKPGVTRQELKAASALGMSRQLLRAFRPKAGEALFVPPGTIHSLGPGLVLFEAEQNSDLTYRLDDFGRVDKDGKTRPLHLDKGLEVTNLKAPAYRDLPRVEFREPYGSRRYVLACEHFAVEELTLKKMAAFEGHPERVEAFSVLAGEGRVENTRGWLGYRTGDTWLLPPETKQYRLVPGKKTRLLKFYVPDLDRDFRRPLARRGVRAATIRQITFA